MTVRVQCPHCGSVCQVDEQHVGAPLQCGNCRQPFSVRPPASPKVRMSTPESRAAAPVLPPPSAPPREPSDEELLLELDGPAAAALAAAEPAAVGAWVAPAAAETWRLDVGAATSPGKVRPRNEDSYLLHQLSWANRDRRHDLAVVAVADGLGGHEAGDLASGLVVRTVGASLAGLLSAALSGQFADPAAAPLAATIEQALKEANRAVYRKAQAEPGCRGMGATVALAVIWDGQVRIGHAGDCRVYHRHAGGLTQVTRDQTLVARMVELGKLSPREALTHPSRNEVTNAVGRGPDMPVAAYQAELSPGDWLIVACDGLHAHVDAALLEDVLRQAAPSASQVAHQLVELADFRGGSDNCTVVAVRCY